MAVDLTTVCRPRRLTKRQAALSAVDLYVRGVQVEKVKDLERFLKDEEYQKKNNELSAALAALLRFINGPEMGKFLRSGAPYVAVPARLIRAVRTK